MFLLIVVPFVCCRVLVPVHVPVLASLLVLVLARMLANGLSLKVVALFSLFVYCPCSFSCYCL